MPHVPAKLRDQARAERCMKGTREDVWAHIDAWLHDMGAPNIFWLSGSPGAGKSAVASDIIHRLRENKQQLAAFFVFKHGNTELTDPSTVWTTFGGTSRSAFDFDDCQMSTHPMHQ